MARAVEACAMPASGPVGSRGLASRAPNGIVGDMPRVLHGVPALSCLLLVLLPLLPGGARRQASGGSELRNAAIRARDAGDTERAIFLLRRAEEQSGKRVLASWYRRLGRAVDPELSSRKVDPDREELSRKLLPSTQLLIEKTETLGDLDGWSRAKDAIVSPRPQDQKTSTLHLPRLVGVGTAVGFELPISQAGTGFVFGHGAHANQYTLGIRPGKTELSVFLDTEGGREALNLLDFTIPMPKTGRDKKRVSVIVALHDHHIWLWIGKGPPKIIPLDKSPLAGRVGFRILPDSGRTPISNENIRIYPR